MRPLISCIMPIRNRREFIPGALRCFDQQTWQNRELIVVDNSDESLLDMIPGPPKCWYEYVGPEPHTVGWMRNRACELARGQFIAHWDSDDWSHPSRLAEQWKMSIAYEASVVGYRSMPFIDEERREAWMYEGQKSYALGTSFFYPRALWKGMKFADLAVAEDGDFLQRAGGALSMDGSNRMVARIHSHNTSPKRGMIAAGEFWTPIDYEQVAALIR